MFGAHGSVSLAELLSSRPARDPVSKEVDGVTEQGASICMCTYIQVHTEGCACVRIHNTHTQGFTQAGSVSRTFTGSWRQSEGRCCLGIPGSNSTSTYSFSPAVLTSVSVPFPIAPVPHSFTFKSIFQ